MKNLAIPLFLMSLALLVAACAPNRLKKSLITPEAKSDDNIAIAAPAPDGRNLQPQRGNANIDLDEVVTLLPPDAIPAVLPEDVPGIMVTATEAEAAGIEPSVRVLGWKVFSSNRYPLLTPFGSVGLITTPTVASTAFRGDSIT